ncbi:MAG TPA: TIGR00730 family Rossman fold protein [Acidimicrobiia bacterium]|nr:TIGR00730 family Rossman fold protein [Acidimicrobiia bacterium]
MPYDLGNPELDAKVAELVAAATSSENGQLIAEMIVTAIKLGRDDASRGDLKLINTALKEMRYSNLVFSRHDEPKVTIYGSARLGEDDANYRITEEFASIMALSGWGVITGAGPGIMEAGSKGAGIEHSYGVNIRLPFEDAANLHIAPERVVNFKYFFTRKLGFVKEAHAFVLLPGGWGTLDETFELLTLVQTGKSDLHPIVLLEAEGTDYWGPMIEFMKTQQLDRGLISPADLALFLHTTDERAAAEHIWHFYSNYHSQRYAGGKLVLRLREEPSDQMLERLSEEFADIVVEGSIEKVPPGQAEIDEGDAVDLHRVAFVFDRRSFGRLRTLIDHLNDISAAHKPTHLPEPMTEEHAERPW